VLHDRAPRSSARVAWVDNPGSIAGKDVERRLEHRAHHPVELIASLDGAVDPIHRLEEPQIRPVFLLGALALGEIEHDSDALVSPFSEGRHTDQHGHAGTVFPEVLLFERLQTPRPPVLLDTLYLAVEQVRGR
jgi:hypothetical protein